MKRQKGYSAKIAMTDSAVVMAANPLQLYVVPTIPTTCIIMMMINCAWSAPVVEKKKVPFLLRLSDSHSSTEWFKFCYPVLFVVCTTSLNEFRLLRHCWCPPNIIVLTSKPVTQPTLTSSSSFFVSTASLVSQKNLCNYFPLSTSAEETSSREGRALLAVIESSCAGSNSIVGVPTLVPICLNPCRISISNYLILTCEEDALHIEPWRSLGGCSIKWRRNKGGGIVQRWNGVQCCRFTSEKQSRLGECHVGGWRRCWHWEYVHECSSSGIK